MLQKLSQVKVITPIEVAVADGFHDVVLADGDAAFEVGDGAGDFQDAVVGSRAQPNKQKEERAPCFFSIMSANLRALQVKCQRLKASDLNEDTSARDGGA